MVGRGGRIASSSMKTFTKLLSPEEARRAYARAFSPKPLGSQRVPLLGALHRVLAEEIRALTDLPPFDRSTVDGYAVRAVDTVHASSSQPVSLAVVDEVLMGAKVEFRIAEGQAARIPTGGALPAGTDAVVMQEHVVRQNGRISVERSARAGENVTRRAEDVKAGEVVLRPGQRLQAQDLGLLAGLGHSAVEVYLKPRVAVIVTGDELVAPYAPPQGSQVRDMNTYTLAGLTESVGGIAQPYGIVRDNLAVLTGTAQRALRTSDALILSGGSSVGEKDLVTDAIAALGEPGIIVHGISIRPGKPTILALANGKPVFGLPGNPVSAMVIFDQFVRPVVEGLAGLQEERPYGLTVRARLATRLSAREREDHVRVALAERGGAVWATPVPGGSGVITSMVRAHGIVVVPAHSTVDEGSEVEVRLFG